MYNHNMSVVESKGYVDIARLGKDIAVLSVPGGVQDETIKKMIVITLCRRFAEVLQPFVLVESTDGRWRDEVRAIAETVRAAAVALRIDDPALGTLSEGIEALEGYERRIARIEMREWRADERTMDPPEMMDRLEQAIQQLAATANRRPVDEWQLNRDATMMHEYCHSLVFKLIDYLDNEEGCHRADRLLERVADVISAAATVDGLSAAAREKLSRFAAVAGNCKLDLKKYRERWRRESRIQKS